ncbi:ATP-binding protein [Aeromonas caviae]|uniref:hybrid sensor histidine kinase/response regulator n=1 Tax=Aeromonas caviae TaxID=648 RepID=UPI00191EBE5A|nr:ATP-binding protein [Aeromonas caviae]MBL0530059.1 response regulator [Aeromonas caviae]
MKWNFRPRGLRPQLMLAFFMLGLVPFLVVTLFFLYSHGKDLTTQTSNHLVSVRNIKKNQLQDYFGNLKEQLINFSQQDFAGNSIGRFYGFTGAFEKLGTTPQEARARAQARYVPGSWDKLQQPDSQVEIEPSISALILADEMYGRVHQRFHRGYADMVRKSNYSDIFLVDLNGDVVYSVTKQANFATNLLSGPYQSSGLGNTFAKIKRRLDGGQKPQQIFEFTDFGRNELTGQVVAYLAAPVMQYDYVRGVVIFELLPDKLNQIMAEREGLGATGETILIGPDKRMRANAWLAPEFSVENSFSPDFRPLQTPLIIKALSGEQGVGPFLSYHDDEVLAAYTQVKVFDTEWAFIAEISTSEAYAPIRQLETLVILLGAGSLLLLILFSRWLSHSITAPLRSLTAAAEQVADGALDHPITIPRTDDDIDRLAQAFRHMQRSVKDKIELIERQTQELQQQVKLTHKQNLSLQQADKLKDELLANTSHELRTPIHGIKGMAESMLASQQDLTEGQQKQLGLIIKSADGLARLVDDLLDYHQMRYGQLEIHPQPVSSKGVIRLVLDLCQHLVQAKPLTLVDKSPAELPPVLADEQRLEQVLYNLVGNAIKYTPQGKVVLSALVEGNFLRIKVTDTGIGIARDHLEHIFEPLVQMSPEVSKQGAGLGLSITRQLVHLMGGELFVESEPSVGSTFAFTLPLASGKAGSLTLDSRRQIEHQLVRQQPVILPDWESEDLPPPPQDAPVILVVDDEPINLHILRHLLQPCGYRILPSSDGHDALTKLAQEPVDLILLDVMMPTLSGFDVCRRLRQQHPKEKLPVLLLTALNQPKEIEEGFNAGANDYLVKPFCKEELFARVRALLEASAGRASLVENRLLKQEIEHRLLLQEQLHQDQERLLALLGEGADPMVFLDEQGGVLFASRALARLLGQEPEAMEGQMLDEWLAAPLASQWPDMTAQPERELDFLVAGQRDTLNARALPINLGGQHAYALTLGTEPRQDDNRMAALENALKSLSRQAIIEDGQLLGELSRLGGEFRSLADDLIRQQDDEPLRRALVDTMRLTLETWQQSTGKGKIVLAEKSKLWRVYMDRSSPQTRTLDKYLNLDTLPKAPRWKTVVASAEYVLKHCALNEVQHQSLHQSTQRLRQLASRKA